MYWYNGYMYSSEIGRGLDIFELQPSYYLTQNEIDAAKQFRLQEFNSQNQPKVVWEPTAVVAKAYMDQLSRSKSISAAQVKTVTDALSKADGRSKAAVDQLETLAGQMELGHDIDRLVRERVFIGRGDTKAHAMRKRLWAMAEVLVPHKEVFDFNQALMDFGAMVCTARKPACQGCPMAKMCRSYPMDVAGAKRKRTR